jgi:hypothetical protein
MNYGWVEAFNYNLEVSKESKVVPFLSESSAVIRKNGRVRTSTPPGGRERRLRKENGDLSSSRGNQVWDSKIDF